MKNLEVELGVRLFDRLGKRVVPTEAGEVLYRHGLRLLEERDRAKQEIDGLIGKISGVLTIGGSTIPGAYLLPPLIAVFKKNNPSISIRMSVDDTARITDAVLSGELCIGVVGARLGDQRLDVHPFQTDELVIAVPKGHAWSRKRSVPLDAIKGEQFIMREQGSGTRKIMEEYLEKAGFSHSDLSVAAVMGSSDAVRQAVKAGLGISILSSRALLDDVEAGRMSSVRVSGLRMERHFFAVLLKGRSRSPLCRAFLDLILKKG